jgi:Transposase DDE domain
MVSSASARRIASPYDLEARYSSQRETYGVGYKVNLTATGDADRPDLITQVITTPATTQDRMMRPTIHHDLTRRDLLPGTHVLDSGDVDAQRLVTAQTPRQIDVVGPAFGSYSRPRLAGQGYDLQAFVMDWEAHRARCPQGQTRVRWTPGWDVAGDPVVRIRFDGATCQVCPTRQACTWAKHAPRQLTVRPQAHHEAIQAACPTSSTPCSPITASSSPTANAINTPSTIFLIASARNMASSTASPKPTIPRPMVKRNA